MLIKINQQLILARSVQQTPTQASSAEPHDWLFGLYAGAVVFLLDTPDLVSQ